MTAPPNTTSEEATTHQGDEILFIVKGKFRFVINDEVFIVEARDIISNCAKNPHFWENIGDTEGVFL